ncbi:MAG: GTP pyrophosphokinase family protein [Clostridia bacterium]|nr:GTP pyrophosphokinase family protein [Clostridia bacterium]
MLEEREEHTEDLALLASLGLDFLLRYKELRMRYLCAMKEIRTKFEVLSTELGVRNDRNPIAGITTRLKSTTAIAEKLHRHGLEFTLTNIEDHLRDIAGVRVVCSYVDDIYMLAEALCTQKDVTVIQTKDYIRSPKPNGYRSLHLIVSVPVFFADRALDIPVEVQIRTIAMDFWATLEHEMRYKKPTKHSEEIAERLRLCAETIAKTDLEMQSIRKEISSSSRPLTKEEELIRKIQTLDQPFLR